jgi:hypothetical protein
VLYELIALRHAFEGHSLPALAMKIVRGLYKPLPLNYTAGLRALVASTLRTDPSLRPSVSDILLNPLIQSNVRQQLSSAQVLAHNSVSDDSGARASLQNFLRPPLSPRPGSRPLQQARAINENPLENPLAGPHKVGNSYGLERADQQAAQGATAYTPSLQSKQIEMQQPADWMADMQARIGAVKDSLHQAPARRHSPTTPEAASKQGRVRGSREVCYGKWGAYDNLECVREGGKAQAPGFMAKKQHPSPDIPQLRSRPCTNPEKNLSPRPGSFPFFKGKDANCQACFSQQNSGLHFVLNISIWLLSLLFQYELAFL